MLLLYIVDRLFFLYFWMIIIVLLSSWFPEAQDNGVIRFIRRYTDPYLNLFRQVIPPIGGMLDISPIIAIFVLRIVEGAVKTMVML